MQTYYAIIVLYFPWTVCLNHNWMAYTITRKPETSFFWMALATGQGNSKALHGLYRQLHVCHWVHTCLSFCVLGHFSKGEEAFFSTTCVTISPSRCCCLWWGCNYFQESLDSKVEQFSYWSMLFIYHSAIHPARSLKHTALVHTFDNIHIHRYKLATLHVYGLRRVHFLMTKCQIATT